MTTIEELISEKEELERLVVKLAAENQQLKDEISEKKANDILFADLIEQWLKSRKMAVKSTPMRHIVPKCMCTSCHTFAAKAQCFQRSRPVCLRNII